MTEVDRAVEVEVEEERNGGGTREHPPSQRLSPSHEPPHPLQRESYHETVTSPVTEAVRQRLPDAGSKEASSYAELLKRSDGTVEGAINLWLAAQDGPILYNLFQSKYFEMIRETNLVEENKIDGETSSDRQARMKALYDELQTELHGPDHKVLAVEASRMAKKKEIKEAVGPLRKRSVSRVASRPATRAESPPPKQRPNEAMHRLRIHTEARREQGEAGVGPSAAAPRGPSQVSAADGPTLGTPKDRSRSAAQYAMNTPAGETTERTEGMQDDQWNYASPDAIMSVPSALEVWQEDSASLTHTEGSTDRQARLQRMTVRLADLATNDVRVTTEGIEFLRLVELVIADYRKSYTEWMAEEPEERRETTLHSYALDSLWFLDDLEWETKMDLMMHMCALTKMTKGSLDQARESAELIWQRYCEKWGYDPDDTGYDDDPNQGQNQDQGAGVGGFGGEETRPRP